MHGASSPTLKCHITFNLHAGVEIFQHTMLFDSESSLD